MKRIYTGWYSARPRREWTERCREDLRQGRRNFLFLLPTRHLIQQVRESLTTSVLFDQANRFGLGVSDQIGTFDDLVDLGLSKEERVLRIDEQGKLAVLGEAVKRTGEQALTPFLSIMDKPGFLQSVMDAIEELKTSGVTVAEMASWQAESADSGRNAYLASFVQIYASYQQLLESHTAGRLLDRQEGYRLAAAHLQQHGAELFSGIETVYIDFLTVTPLQFPLVEAVCRYVPNVEIFMPYPRNAEGIRTLAKHGQKLIERLQALGVEHVELNPNTEQSQFAILAQSVFEEDRESLPASLPIELIPSATILQEVRAVAKEIKRLVKNGRDVTEMAIVVADDAAYRPLLRKVFQEQQIAIRLPDIRNLLEVPIVRMIKRELDQVEPRFPKQAAYAEYADHIRQWAERERLMENLYLRAAQNGFYTLQDLRRDVRAWQTCVDLLESLVRAKRLYGDREVSFARFWREWKELMGQGKVQVDGGAGRGVQVLRPAEMRGMEYPVVFVLGLNEGRFPNRTGDHWLIERMEQVAARHGRIFQQREQAELQSLLFRFILQAATDRLYLSYLTPEADERNLPSSYLEAVIRAVEPGDWTAPTRFQSALSRLPIPDSWCEVSGQQEWRERVSLWLGGQTSLHVSEAPDEQMLQRFEQEDWQHVLERLAVEAERESEQASRYAGRLESAAVQAILREKYGPDHAWSVSALNDYALCPFKFFAARVLKIEPHEEMQDGIPVTDRGIFLHDLNQRLLLPLTQVERVEMDQAMQLLGEYDRIFAETCRDWESRTDDNELTTSSYWPVEKERLRKEMRLWFERELNRLVESRMRPVYLEWSFGNEDVISLTVGGELMHFRGRIDRIDLAEDGSRFAIYDYKTSLAKYKGKKDVEDGTNWQLPVYLAAFAEWIKQQGTEATPLGGGFQKMSPQAEKLAGIWAQDVETWGIKDIKKTDQVEDLPVELDASLAQIAEQRNLLRSGVFDARPRVECDPYCKYAAVCRFDSSKRGRTK